MSLLDRGDTTRHPHAACPKTPHRAGQHVFRAVGYLNQRRRGKKCRAQAIADSSQRTRYACCYCGAPKEAS